MLKLRGAYKGGEKQGQFKTFYNSGQVMISGQYISGHQDGTWIYYTEKGEISKREFYNKGTLLKVEESGIK
jgi:antitoxin component YwqK of YwqJK toxin-antitoxin module